MTSIIRISDNEFRVSGIINYYQTHVDTITQNGKTYVNETRTLETYDCDKEFTHKFEYDENMDAYYSENNWIGEVYDYSWLGVRVIIYTPRMFFEDQIAKSIHVKFSENQYIQKLSWIFTNRPYSKSGIVPDNLVTNAYTSKDYPRVSDYKNLSIPINLESYGYNNSFYIEIPFIEILKLDYVSLPENIKYQIKDKIKRETNHSSFSYRKKDKFFKDLTPANYFKRKLTDEELIITLNKLNKKKELMLKRAEKSFYKEDFINHELN